MVRRALVLLAALVLAAATSVAPPASATCLSFSGLLNIGSGCTSNFGSLAIGLGPNTTAVSTGLLTGALAIGNKSSATATGALDLAIATGSATVVTRGTANVGYGGSDSKVTADGLLALGLSLGRNTLVAGQPGSILNVALSAGDGNIVTATGIVNLALNLGGDNTVTASGTLTNALNLLGDRNFVAALGTFNSAVNLQGRNNHVESGPGSFVVTGAWRWIGHIFRSPSGFFIKLPRITIGGPGVGREDSSGGVPNPILPFSTGAVSVTKEVTDVPTTNTPAVGINLHQAVLAGRPGPGDQGVRNGLHHRDRAGAQGGQPVHRNPVGRRADPGGLRDHPVGADVRRVHSLGQQGHSVGDQGRDVHQRPRR